MDSLRAPISSGCTANPTNADGATCQGGAIGTPFLLYTAGRPDTQKLFAQAFAPTDVSTLPATDISDTGATLEWLGESGWLRRLHPLRLRCDDGIRHQHARTFASTSQASRLASTRR